MRNSFYKDISYLSFTRIFGLANIPLQTFVFVNYLSSELIQNFFILSGLFSIVVLFEGGAGTVLTYEYNRRLHDRAELVKLSAFFKRRFLKLTMYYLVAAVFVFFAYESVFPGSLNIYTYQYIFCVGLMGINLNLYPIICISEGSGNVRNALLIKSIAPISSMLVFLLYIIVTGNISAFYILPATTLICYVVYIFYFCKSYAKDYFFVDQADGKHEVSDNVSKANISWGSGYILTQGFPLLLPFVLTTSDAAKLILTANLLNAFVTFICIGATIIGPRIPEMIKKHDFGYRKFVLKNIIFIYAILFLCLIFFDDLLTIFYLVFSHDKFLSGQQLFLFCVSFGYIPLYHYSVILLKGAGVEPFVDSNVYVAIATGVLFFVCASLSLTNFLWVYIWFRLIFVTFIYLYKMLTYYYEFK